MPRAAVHTHKLKRFRYKSTGHKIFHCVLPDCYFKVETALALGKKSICWRCGKEFNVNEYSLRLAKPHCNNCTKSKVEDIAEQLVAKTEAEDVDDLKSRLAKMGSGFGFDSKEEEI